MNRREYIKNTAVSLGIGLVGISLTDILLSCRAETTLSWKPIFFTNKQAALIAEIAEIILPKTQTPGAKELAVPQFIDKMVFETMDEASRNELLKGLKDFEMTVKKNYDLDFLALNDLQKTEFLNKLDKDKPRSGMSMWGINLEPDAPKPTFFKIIKSLTIFGFYTSEEIGRNVLSYDPVPGEYIACMPLNDRNAWTE